MGQPRPVDHILLAACEFGAGESADCVDLWLLEGMEDARPSVDGSVALRGSPKRKGAGFLGIWMRDLQDSCGSKELASAWMRCFLLVVNY